MEQAQARLGHGRVGGGVEDGGDRECGDELAHRELLRCSPVGDLYALAVALVGINHVALNLKFSRGSVGEVLDEIGTEVIPHLSISEA